MRNNESDVLRYCIITGTNSIYQAMSAFVCEPGEVVPPTCVLTSQWRLQVDDWDEGWQWPCLLQITPNRTRGQIGSPLHR